MTKAQQLAQYRRIDPELLKEITAYVIKQLKDQEEKAIEVRNDRKRANVKLLIRKYREIAEYVDGAVFEVAQVREDTSLNDLLELMGSRRESFHLETMSENVATAKLLFEHMTKMLEVYRISCEQSGKEEEMRRYRVIRAMYLDQDKKSAEDVAGIEFITRSTVFRDVDAAADRLAVYFFGIQGIKFL